MLLLICKYAHADRNIQTITANILITFFKAYSIRIPTMKPPLPIVVALSTKLSLMLIILYTSPKEINYSHAMIIFISLLYFSIPLYGNVDKYDYPVYEMKNCDSIHFV